MRSFTISNFILFFACTITWISSSVCYGEEENYQQLQKQLQNLQEELTTKKGEYQQLQENFESLQSRVDSIENSKQAPENLQQKISALEKSVKELTAKEESSFNVFWKNGFKLESADKEFSLGVGGRIFLDLGFVHEDTAIKEQLEEIDDFAKFRTARLNAHGTIYGKFIFKAEFDFVKNVAFKDVYMGVKGLPYGGTLKAGFFKEPFGLEEYTSSRYITFLERASLNTFVPGRNIGLAYFGHSDRMTYSAGIFREVEGDDPPEVVNDGGAYGFTTRLTALPLYEDKAKQLFHLGVAYSYRNPLNDEVRFRSRPEIGVGPRFVDTGTIANVDDVHLFGLEGALVSGPFSVQSEAVFSIVNGDTREDFWGYYFQASYFLTGEFRPYSNKKGGFKRLKPTENFLSDGWGAWELAVRYSYIDLGINNEQRMGDITVGLNWYLNPHMRIMANYIYSRVDDIAGSAKTDANIFVMRFQIDF